MVDRAYKGRDIFECVIKIKEKHSPDYTFQKIYHLLSQSPSNNVSMYPSLWSKKFYKTVYNFLKQMYPGFRTMYANVNHRRWRPLKTKILFYFLLLQSMKYTASLAYFAQYSTQNNIAIHSSQPFHSLRWTLRLMRLIKWGRCNFMRTIMINLLFLHRCKQSISSVGITCNQLDKKGGSQFNARFYLLIIIF